MQHLQIGATKYIYWKNNKYKSLQNEDNRVKYTVPIYLHKLCNLDLKSG